MRGFTVVEIDGVQVQEGDLVTTDSQALLVAGVDENDDTTTVRLLRVDEDGGLALSNEQASTQVAMLQALNSIAETMRNIQILLEGLAED